MHLFVTTFCICRKALIVTCFIVSTFLANVGLSAENDWPQFLGPNRNGISAETGLLEQWPADGPKEVWRVPGGVGMSGFAIGDGRLITMVQTTQSQFVLAVSPTTGKLIWKTEIAPAYGNTMGNGPRGTPTISGDRVFVFTGEGVVAALELSSGKMIWAANAVKDLKGAPAEYGMACSPLVVGDRVVVIVGAPKATVVAFNAKTGKTEWAAGNETIGYSSPVLLDVGGRKQIVAFTGSAALGIDPASGKLLWRYGYVTDYKCNIATPIGHDGKVLISSGENHGSALLALKPNGDVFDVEEVWTSFGPKSVLRSEWQTAILLNGYLYGLDNVGSAGPVTHLTCVNATTGERAWQQLRFGKSNLVSADGKLFLSTMKGELVVAKASPNGYEEIGRKLYVGKTRQAPAISNGLLYLRDDRDIVCIDVRKP
ncbi:MAG: outer membrane protein assembly factor BamB [Pirellulaceae bacterium]|jgi:outer membrane protein assembly factor BamB